MRKFLSDLMDGAAVVFGAVLALALFFAPIGLMAYLIPAKGAGIIALVVGLIVYIGGGAWAFTLLCERKGWQVGPGVYPSPVIYRNEDGDS